LSQDSCVINEFGSYVEVHVYKVSVISFMQCKKVVMNFVLFHVMKEHGCDFKSVVVTELHGFNQR
jgi:hypothetical protein